MTPKRSRLAVAAVLTLLSVSLMLANHFYGHRSYLDRLNTDRTLYQPAAPWHDPAWLESPRVSFLLVFLSTIEFYVAGLLTVLAISTLLPRPLWRQA